MKQELYEKLIQYIGRNQAGFLISAREEQASIIFGVVDGVLAISGINY